MFAIVNFVVALSIIVMNIYYFINTRNTKKYWRWLKLTYAFNAAIIAATYILAALDGGRLLIAREHAITLLLVTILAGSLMSALEIHDIKRQTNG